MSPYFSVLLPVYNGARTVMRAIESVQDQTDPDWEIIAVDDGSSDGSPRLLDQAGAADSRIRVFRIPNSGGPARPRNRAIAEAKGQVLCLLDQDDWWLPEKLQLQRPLTERPGVGIVYGDAWIETPGADRQLYSSVWGAPRRGEATSELIAANFIPALTTAVPVGVARAVGGLDERFVGVDDYHWWLRIAMAGYKVEPVDQPVAVYTVGEHNLSHDHDLHLASMLGCLSDLAGSHPRWRIALLHRREEVRRHALDFHANRLASTGALHGKGLRAAGRAAPLVRSWPELKRVVKSALPPAMRRR